jgi:hypothetical protein
MSGMRWASFQWSCMMQSSDIWHSLINLFRLEGKKMWCGNVEKNIVRERLCLYFIYIYKYIEMSRILNMEQ